MIIVIVLTVNTYPLVTAQELIFDSKNSEMLRTANLVSNNLASLKSINPDNIASVMSVFTFYENTRLVVADHNGQILFDNHKNDGYTGRYALFPEVFTALSGQDVFRSICDDSSFTSIAAVPITYKNQTLGAVLYFEYEELQAGLLMSIQTFLRITTIVIALLAAFLSISFSSMFRRRLDKLTAAINHMKNGEYSHRIQLNGLDEISALSNEFNDLSVRLQRTEDLRRQFVANASHELKTPLASIKLLADSVVENEDMSISDIRDFMSDISHEITRLTRITERLLSLTKLDVSIPLVLRPVDMAYVIDRAKHMLEPLAAHFNINVECALSDGCIVFADEDGMYQIVFNLMENAIKYNENGGSVTVLCFVKENKVHCIVDDTGIGLPDNELKLIFDRFYRVDKARARETGGTGLGLSIVKMTAEHYGGEVWAENRAEKGSRFIAVFPLYDPEGGKHL